MKKEIIQGKTRCARMGLCFVLSLSLVSLAVADEDLRQPATEQTRAANAAVLSQLDFTDTREFDFAMRGLIEPGTGVVTNSAGKTVWSAAAYAYMTNSCYSIPDGIPSEANPSLWRHTVMNQYAGLFTVVTGNIYQVRGYDMANMTFIRTPNNRWIAFDVMMCKENAQVAMRMMAAFLGHEPDIAAVIYSHSHIDHFGGVGGVVTAEQLESATELNAEYTAGKTAVIAPEGFLEHAVSENVYAGKAMGRRAQYQYGVFLTPGERGKMGMGIGLGQATGTVSLYAPTRTVRASESNFVETVIDGLSVCFQLTPGTEAPAEMNAYFPDYKALWLAENCTATLHNLYTLRGAQVRDGAAWSKYILEAVHAFVDRGPDAVQVVFQSHNWPHWNANASDTTIRDYMEDTAAIYRFINDQTLHYINLGRTANEISHLLTLPPKLAKVWYVRQYYGTVSHDARAVYQKYMGFYDANPVNLNPLAPTDSARKLVRYLGGADAALARAREDYAKGEYQWVAQITRELVYADPSNTAARRLCADALEQLGYQSESGTWRNCYLAGAMELRFGNLASQATTSEGMLQIQSQMTAQMIFDYVGLSIDVAAALEAGDLSFNICVKETDADAGRCYGVKLREGILLVTDLGAGAQDANLTVTRLQLFAALLGPLTDATPVPLRTLKMCMTQFPGGFNIIEPLDAPTEGTEWNPWQAGATQSDDIRVWLDDGTLRIDGAGVMQDFTDDCEAPWSGNLANVTNVSVSGGVTKLGTNSLRGLAPTAQVNGLSLSAAETCAAALGAAGAVGQISPAEVESIAIVNGRAQLGVSVYTNGQLEASSEGWGKATSTVIDVPAEGKQGFFVLKTSEAK